MSEDNEEKVQGNFEGVWYHWTCGACQEMNETEEDVRNSEATCEHCSEENEVQGNT